MMGAHNCVGHACAICHPRCECHECTQARARENQGGMLGSVQAFVQCPLCGQLYQGGHTCVRAQTASEPRGSEK
jgi:hypothetical protein